MADPNYETHNPVKFNDDLRARYLDLLKLGFGRLVAAETIGVNIKTVRRYYHAHTDFLQDMEDAELNMVDEAQKGIVDAMRDREPWAIKMILERRARNVWADSKHIQVDVQGTIDHNLLDLPLGEALEAIEAEIAERQRALGSGHDDDDDIQDAEVLEDDE